MAETRLSVHERLAALRARQEALKRELPTHALQQLVRAAANEEETNVALPSKDALRAMLEEEERLRLCPETQAKMREVTEQQHKEWLDVVEEIQIQLVRKFGFGSTPRQEALALHALRTAHVTYPEFRALSVYVRNNRARDGDLKEGDTVPDVPLMCLPPTAPSCSSEALRALHPRPLVSSLLAGLPFGVTAVVAGSYT